MIRVKYFLLVLNLMHRRRHCPVEEKKRGKKIHPVVHKDIQEVV